MFVNCFKIKIWKKLIYRPSNLMIDIIKIKGKMEYPKR